MKFNKKSQYGLLFVLYLARSGTCPVSVVAESLGVPKDMLQGIAWTLAQGGVVTPYSGKGGGYALRGDPTVRAVLNALSTPVSVIDEAELSRLGIGSLEHRALAQFVRSMKATLSPLLSRKVRNVAMEIVAADQAAMNRISDKRAAMN